MNGFFKRVISALLLLILIATGLTSTLFSVSAESFLPASEQGTSNNPNTLMAGIDISGWQTSVNWSSVKSAGVEFAMFRLTSYSSATHSYTKDPMLDSHITGAKSQGIHIGGYFFSYAKSVDEVKAEANMILGILEDYPQTFDFPIVFDAECANIQGFAADACVEFCKILEDSGYWVMIYANNNWFNNYITPATKIEGYDLWQAYYPWVAETQTEKYRGYTPAQAKTIDFSSRKALNSNNENVYMWQISQQTTVNGIGTNCVDMDLCVRDYSRIIRAHGFNTFTATATQEHGYQAGNDHTHHYQICHGCGDRMNIEEHSYTPQYKNETQHDIKCACGYVKPDSLKMHEYDVLLSDEATHVYACVCGVQSETSRGEHSYVLKHDAEHHYKACDYCEYVDESSIVEHNFNIASHDGSSHWIECECKAKSELGAHTPSDGKCKLCGYHRHTPLFDSSGHWQACKACNLRTAVEMHSFDSSGCCKNCGYLKNSACEHEMKLGSCTKCGYHVHQYSCDADGHTMICECATEAKVEMHTLVDEICTVCGFDSSPDEPDTDVSDSDFIVETGCESYIGASSVVLCVSVALGCGFIRKKKKD